MSDLAGLSLADASRLIEERKLSPVELTRAYLDRVDRLDKRLNAFITVIAEEALRSAREAESAIQQGNYKGALHGAPLALKDIFSVRGIRMTAGSKILEKHIPDEDAPVVSRLKEAGAVVLGKLNLHEFAFGATGVNPHYGPARNPWNSDRISGGSSSGSGVAVAAAECAGALGTDTGGSIRIPASLCGIVGFKPTYGRVSKRGVLPLSWSLDHVGPITRTVEDAAMLFRAIAVPDSNEAGQPGAPPREIRSALKPDLYDVKIGIPNEFFFENLDPAVESAVRGAVKVLEGLGAQASEVPAPYIKDIPGAVTAIMLPEALAYHQKWLAERPDDYGDDVRYRLELGSTYLAVHYVQAQRLRELAVNAWKRDVFSLVDLVVTPTTPITAPSIEGGDLQTTFSLIRYTNPLNLLGVPAISVPCGFDERGLPIGLQIAGRWSEEETVLNAAYAFEQATEWHRRKPPLY